MLVDLEIQILDKLADYLVGEMSLRDFQNWFVPIAWDIEATGSPAARDLAYEIELHLAEYTSGHRTKKELREKLLPLVRNYTVPFEGRSSGPDARQASSIAALILLGSLWQLPHSLPQEVGFQGQLVHAQSLTASV